MPKIFRLNQIGVIHLIPLIIILAGIIAGVYLVQHPAIFKPKAYSQPIDPLLYNQRINNLRTTFKISEDISNDQVQQAVKDDLLKSDIVIQGDIANGDAEVSVIADCTNQEQTNYVFSEYGVFSSLCLSDEDKEKAIEFIKSGAESAADFVVPYSQAKQALEFGSDIQKVRDLLRQSGLAERIQTNSVSGPDSGFDGYVVTLLRIKELEQDVSENPDGTGKLTWEQEEARREYVAALRNLWEKQHSMLFQLVGIAAITVIDKPLRIVGEFAKPVTGPIITKLNEVKNPIFDFLNNSWGKLTKKVTEIGFNQISRLQEAKSSFINRMLPIFKPEEREEALRIFERWFSGNYNPATGKITLYRFVDLPDEMLNDIVQKGIKPRGVDKVGSIDELLKYLDEGNNYWDTQLADAYREQQAGRDISEFIEHFSDSSGGGYPYDIVTYWTTEVEPAAFFGQNRQYRITVELDPTDAWRGQTAQSVIQDQEKLAKRLQELGRGFEEWKRGEFEWTVLGEIPSSRIKEITDLISGQTIYAGGILLIAPIANTSTSTATLNCSYSQEDSNCPSGFTVCTGHTDEEICVDKKPEECFNLVQCQYDASEGSTCTCSD